MKTEEHWKRIGLFSHHGIAVPLFSLRSQKSCGIGEFLDLLPLIDWCKSVHFDTIQLLPLNDTGNDPSPYNLLSSCALDPIYLSLADLPEAHSLLQELHSFLPLMQLPHLARGEVKRKKIEWLRRYFAQTFPSLALTDAYRSFCNLNQWLPSYALFKALKEQHGGISWQDWPLELQSPPQREIPSFRSSIDFHSFLQFHCFSQMKKVRDHASRKKVFLKGDLPLLPSPDSADVWANRSFFNLDLSAGAPPDAFNPLGQKWGFPLFLWENLRKTNFHWWKERLRSLEPLFHIYRIDHVAGFFRMWGIPKDKKAIAGSYLPANPTLWEKQGREILEMMIETSPLLPMAEDLGTIPQEVRTTLKELGICSTKVIRWERRWKQDQSYIPYAEYEPLSLTTVSTHDIDTLQLWWKSSPSEAIPFAHFKHWTYHPDLSREEHISILRDAHQTPSHFHINLLQEYLALFPELVSPNPEEERINVPGTLLPTNWTYRFRPFVEELISHRPLADCMRSFAAS